MKAEATLIAFHRPGIDPAALRRRPIEIPVTDEDIDELGLFELAYQYGQNDFQPVEGCHSVSVGDLITIVINDKPVTRLVWCIGFTRAMTDTEIELYKTACSREREFDEADRLFWAPRDFATVLGTD